MTIKQLLESYDEPLNEGILSGFKRKLISALAGAVMGLALLNPVNAHANTPAPEQVKEVATEYVNNYVGNQYFFDKARAPYDLDFYLDFVESLIKPAESNIINKEMRNFISKKGLTNEELAKTLRKATQNNFKNPDNKEFGYTYPIDIKQIDKLIRDIKLNEVGIVPKTTGIIKKINGIEKGQKYFNLFSNEFSEPIRALKVYVESIAKLGAILEKCDENHPDVKKAQEFFKEKSIKAKALIDAYKKSLDNYIERFDPPAKDYKEFMKGIEKVENALNITNSQKLFNSKGLINK